MWCKSVIELMRVFALLPVRVRVRVFCLCHPPWMVPGTLYERAASPTPGSRSGWAAPFMRAVQYGGRVRSDPEPGRRLRRGGVTVSLA